MRYPFKTCFLCVVLFACVFKHGDVLAQQIRWTEFENLTDSIRNEPKPLLIFIHTDWCKFCAMQKKNTFTNEQIVSKINSDFYALSLNGESKNTIKFLNRNYEYQASGSKTGVHELAEHLGKDGGQLTYPTTVLMTHQLSIASRKVGFLDTEQLDNYLNIVSP